jgi:O-antigen/teichoic acid export membrane protein
MTSKLKAIVGKIGGSKLQKLLNDGSARSKTAKIHIAISLAIRAGNAMIGFLMVPLIINFLGSEQYGIWITLWTIIAWFNVMNFGLGNGLRNHYAIAKAKDDIIAIKTYISSAYVGVILLSLIIVAVFFLIIPLFISWEKILNTPAYLSTEIPDLILVVFLFFILNFIAKLIGTILLADQKAAVNNSIQPLANVLSLAIIFFIIQYNPDRKLVAVGAAISAMPFVVNIVYSLIYFNRDYKDFKPSFRFFDFEKLKSLMSLGIRFFVIQIAGIIILFTDNLIITQLFGPTYVTPYSNAQKLFFFVFNPIFITALSTLWSAFTDAYERNDIKWIKNVLRTLNKICLFIGIFTVILVVFSKFIFRLWLGEETASDIPMSLSILMGAFVVLYCYVNIYAYAINGIGKIKIMLIGNIVGAIINIPLSILFGKYLDMGITGIILATFVTQLPFIFLLPVQVKRILNKTAKGIWNK